MKSIEHGRDLSLSSQNPFDSETPLYEKKERPGDIPVAVVVPDFYHVALPNLGHQMVEYQVNQADGFRADRAYLNHDYSILKERPSAQPELIFISMSYEGSYIRALRMLDQLGCPINRRERTEHDPLVIIGGWSVSRNPLPLFEIADVIGIGDSEHLISNLTEAYRAHRGSRDDFFHEIVETQGVIIPSRYRVSTADGYLTEWEAHQAPSEIHPNKSGAFPYSRYLSPDTDYNIVGYYERQTFFSMEIVEACGSKCAFCASGFREQGRDFRDAQAIGELAEWAHQHGANLSKLFFPANSSVEATKEIMRELMRRGLNPRVGSAKAEKIDREYIDLVGKSGQEKIAFAPETGDYALRRALGKPGMTDEVLQNVIVASIEAGIPNLDFYLIMNLPGEAPDSYKKTLDLMGEFHHLAQSRGLAGRIRLSAPNFFPKAWTPFQYAASGDIESYTEKMANFERDLAGRVVVSSMRGDVDLLSQNIMSRGGMEVGQLMSEVYRKLKEREAATGTFTPDTMQDWREAMAALHLNEDAYFAPKSPDKQLPWHHIHLNPSLGLSSMRKAWEVFQHRRAIFMVE